MIPVGDGIFAEVDEIDLLPALLLCSWTLNRDGYVRGEVDSKALYLHQFIANRMGLSSEQEVDHKDRNKLNCRRSNLRNATRSEQTINTALHPNNTSGYKNITWNEQSQKWRVDVRRNNRRIYIGSYLTIEEAVRQRNAYYTRNSLELPNDNNT